MVSGAGSASGRLAPGPSRRSRQVRLTPQGLNVLSRVSRMALRYPWRVALAMGATIVAANFQLLIPQFLGAAVDHAHALLSQGPAATASARESLLHVALMLLGVSVLRGIFTLIHNYYGESVGHYVAYDLRMAFYEKLQRLAFSYHDRVHTGELITRGMLDLEGVRQFFNAGLVRAVLLVNLIGIGATLLISADVALGLLSLSFVPFVAWRSSVTRLRLRQMWLELQERLGVMSRIMEENLGGIRVVRAFAAQDHEMALFDESSALARDISERRVDVRVRNTTTMTFSFFIAMGLVLWLGGLKVIDGDITVGKLTEFLGFMTILQMPVRQLGMMVNAFARGSTCGVRLFEVLDAVPAIRDRDDALPLSVNEGILRFEDVDFDYGGGGRGKATLRGINFEARRGQTIGIVGPPGSGKSTVAHLVPRFYDVTGGRITIDGQDLRAVSLKSLREAVGIVQQDAFLFTASIDNNIAYGDPWATEERIGHANSQAQLHEYVSRLPAEYGTLVGERGVSLSGGQRQRLTIARGLLTDPAILIFDDSTASIDAGTERRIRAALQESAENRITIIISHRLSSFMHADEILFLDEGRIVERGTHQELIAKEGRYHNLYQLQIRPGEDHGVAGDVAGGAHDDGDVGTTP